MTNHSTKNERIRWLPKHGTPNRILESITQWLIKFVAFLPFYMAVILTTMFLLIIFGIPLIGGGIW